MTSQEITATRNSDVAAWGVAAHAAHLVVNGVDHLGTDAPWTIDVENNLDGSFAGLGASCDGVTLYFFTKLPSKYFLRDVQLVGHNIKYDVQMLRKWGLDVSPDQIVWDTQLAEYVKDSTRNRYGLKDLAREYFGADYPTYKELTGTGQKAISIGQLAPDVLANYNGCDVLYTFKLYQKQLAEFTDEQTQYMETIELPTLRVLLEMEERGVQIDTAYIRTLDAQFGIDLAAAKAKLDAVGVINLNSPKQVKQFLLEKAHLSLPSTAAEELRKHANVPLIKDLLRYRELTKLRSTYTNVLIEKSEGQDAYRLHARFNQTVTHTGRLSSSEPNLQNIPTRTSEGDAIRGGFVAQEGSTLIDADYSQIEPRLMAHFSGDEKLRQIFVDGKDLYDSVAELVGCERQIAKILWLAMAYNAGAFKISITAGITRTQAEVFLTRMKLAYQQFFYWRSKVIAQAEIDGGVHTLFGRWIPLPAEMAHLGPNYLVQGSAAEIMKLAIQATRECSPVCTVHDELIFERASGDLVEIKKRMESVVDLFVHLKVEMGQAHSWKDAKK